MGLVRFQVSGIMGQPRPRFSTINGRVRAYDSASATEYKEQIATACMIACRKKNIKMPIEADGKGFGIKILAAYKCPKSFSKIKERQALADEIKPTKKPDADNIAKIVLDGLNQVMWHDDNQVTRLEIEKTYSNKEYVDIEIKWD